MNETKPITLAPGWYEEVVVPGVDPMQPGLFEWRIESVGVYIGQYTHPTRPRGEYGNNVVNILNDLPYRKDKPGKFRLIHRELAQVVGSPRQVRLTFLENVTNKPARNRRKRELIAERRREAEQGGLPVLNSN